MDNRERLSIEVSDELKALVDADPRFNREVVEAALWREFGGHRKGALEARIEEQKNRVSMIQSEIKDRDEELKQEQSRLESLRDRFEEMTASRESVYAEAEEVLRLEQLDPENGAVLNFAEKAEVPVEQFINTMRERLSDDA